MEVLTKILQQGTEFDTLAETVLADRFERLVELVTMMGDQGELPIAMALANVVPGSQWVCSKKSTRSFLSRLGVTNLHTEEHYNNTSVSASQGADLLVESDMLVQGWSKSLRLL